MERTEIASLGEFGLIDHLTQNNETRQAGTLLSIGDDQVQGVRLKLNDLFKAPDVTWTLLQELPPSFYAGNWTQTQGNLFSAIKMEKAMMTLLLLLIVAVAASLPGRLPSRRG